MAFRSLLGIVECTVWVLKKYQELQETRKDSVYRIIEFKQAVAGQSKLVIQLIGKSTFIELAPKEIVSDDSFLEGFSKKDIRLITYLAYYDLNKPKYKIETQILCDESNNIQFQLKNYHDDQSIKKSAREIFSDKEIINSLSKDDAQKINYVAGYEVGLNSNFFEKK